MVRIMFVSSFFVLVLLTTGSSLSQDSPANNSHFEAITACVGAVQTNVDEGLINAPEFADLQDALTWVARGLQGELRAVFYRAAHEVRSLNLTSVPSDRDERERYLRRLYDILFGEFLEISYCPGDSSLAAFNKFSQEVYLAIIADSSMIVEELRSMGYAESFEIKQVLPLLVLMEGIGVRWPGYEGSQLTLACCLPHRQQECMCRCKPLLSHAADGAWSVRFWRSE